LSDNRVSDSILEMYIFETSQQLERLEEIMINCGESGACETEAINEIFRIMHTLKGSSAMMTYNNISSLSHGVEGLFFYIREEKPEEINCVELSDIVLECIDFIKVEIEKIKAGDESDGDVTGLKEKAEAFLAELKNSNNQEVSSEEMALYYYKAHFTFSDDCEMECVRCFSIIHNLEDIISELYTLPEDVLNDPDASDYVKKNGFDMVFISFLPADQIQEILTNTAYLKELKFEELKTKKLFDKAVKAVLPKKAAVKKTIKEDISSEIDLEEEKINTEEEKISEDSPVEKLNVLIKDISQDKKEYKAKSEHKEVSQQTVISVNVDKLDKLMDLVGEMVISEAMVTQNPEITALEIDSFQKASRQLHKITNELQDIVMSIRMVPLSKTFLKMHRIVHDMSKKLEREVKLQLIGEETEVDKNIIEKISDPLMHLIRNSIDHGIEDKEERLKAGKDTVGIVTLEAKNSGSDVLVIVKDDGRGLSRRKILDKARKQGILEKSESEMSDRDVYNLILAPGFSTNEQITEYSGRGVGMDVVSKNITDIGGAVSVDSKEGECTIITLKMPLTLAIIDGMNVKVGKSRYTIPIASIKESFRPKEKEVFTDTDGNEMIMVRGECYPIIRLNKLYSVNDSKEFFEEGILIMVEDEKEKACLFADELLGQQQVVVKALPSYIKSKKDIKGVGGCTLLGDGNISLILDVSELVSKTDGD